MSAQKNKPEKGGTDWIELVTGRVGKITALAGAISALLAVILTQFSDVQEKLKQFGVISPPPPCVEVKTDQVVFPNDVKYSEWDNMRIRLSGRNNCERPLGLYVTFVRRTTKDPRFTLRVPYDDLAECTGKAPLLEPKCWDRKKPVANIGKREWEWETPPPPLSRLSDSRSTETILVAWEVRDLDEPNKSPIAAGSAPIKVTYDTGEQ